MSYYQKKTGDKRLREDQQFVPRIRKDNGFPNESLGSSRESFSKKLQHARSSSKTEIDLRDTLLIQNKFNMNKEGHRNNKGNNLLNNIKYQLTNLKSQVDRVIHHDVHEVSYEQESRLGRNLRQTDSREHSQGSVQSFESQPLKKRPIYRNLPEQSNILSDLTQRKLKFVEEQNEVIRCQLKMLKSKFKRYQEDAEREISLLRQNLTSTTQSLAYNEQELHVYKQEVEGEMAVIKKMLQGNAEKKPDPSLSRNLLKSLEEQNSNLRKSIIQIKEQLFTKEKTIIAESSKHQVLARENHKLKQELQHINQQFLLQLSNISMPKCAESHINYDLSRSKIQIDDIREKDEYSKAISNIQFVLQRKQSDTRSRDSNRYLSEEKVQELNRHCRKLKEQNSQLNLQLHTLQKSLEQSHLLINSLTRQRQQLCNKIVELESELSKDESSKYKRSAQPQTNVQVNNAKQIKDRLQTFNASHQLMTDKSKRQNDFEKPFLESNCMSDDILKQQDKQIQSLKKDAFSKNQELTFLKQTIDNLNFQIQDLKLQLQASHHKMYNDKNELSTQLQILSSRHKSQMNIVESTMEELNQHIRLITEDKDKKDQFIRDYLLNKVENEVDSSQISKILTAYQLAIPNNQLIQTQTLLTPVTSGSTNSFENQQNK